MHIPPKHYGQAYDSIVAAARSSTSPCPIMMVPAMDVDALLASKMLSQLLSRDSVAYRVHPVSGWKELSRVASSAANEDVAAVVFVNVGASVDLSDVVTFSSNVAVHVIDSHRPFDLENVFGGDSLTVWDDGDVDELTDERTAYLAMRYEPESSSDESESEEEELDSDGEPRKRVKVDSQGRQRLPTRERQRHKTKLNKYYSSGSHTGQSVAGQMYVLATLKGYQDNELLWMAIVGLTYQLTTSLIDRDTYDVSVVPFTREVARINIDPPTTSSRTGEPTSTFGPDDRNIRPSEELRFMLFRHWNLYDAMFHSGYIAGKLKLWRDRGRKNLQGMLAKMGFSLSQCQQTYSHMDMELKKSLRTKVEGLAPEYGLFDLSFSSFVRAYGYQAALSASDCVEALSSILEVAEGVKLDFVGAINGPANLAEVGQATYWDAGRGVKRWTDAEDASVQRDVTEESTASVDNSKRTRKEDVWWVRNFWLGWDALSTDTTLLRAALPLSMALHRSVVRQGTFILDKQAIKTLRSFRLAVIREGPDLTIFTHPATLTRLGIWLIDSVRDLVTSQQQTNNESQQVKTTMKGLPFVLACLDENRDSFLIVGVNGAIEYGDVRKNKFGTAFQNAAQQSNARARHDRFEESVCEVQKDDLSNFIEKLHLAL